MLAGVSGLPVGLHILTQRHEEPQQTFNRKLPKLASQHFGYIGLTDSKQTSGFDLFQPSLFHDRVDLEYQLSLDEMLFRIWHTDFFEYITAAFFVAFGLND